MKIKELLGEILTPPKAIEVFLRFSLKPNVCSIDIWCEKKPYNFCRLYCYLFKMEWLVAYLSTNTVLTEAFLSIY